MTDRADDPGADAGQGSEHPPAAATDLESEFYAAFDEEAASEAARDSLEPDERLPHGTPWRADAIFVPRPPVPLPAAEGQADADGDPPAAAATAGRQRRAATSRYRRGAALVVMALAIVVGGLAQGDLADKLLVVDRGPAVQDVHEDGPPITLPSAWRRLPSRYGPQATPDPTRKVAASETPLDAQEAVPARTTPNDRPPPTQGDPAGAPEAGNPAKDSLLLPMLLDAICAIPTLQTVSTGSQPRPAVGRAAEAPSRLATPDAVTATRPVIDWPMLEPWSRLPDERVAAAPSMEARVLAAAVAEGATVATRPLPPPPIKTAPKPRPSPPAAASAGPPPQEQPAAPTRSAFEAASREAP